ncbi:MAG TPA: BadF/BadG/BcrA/BcrD ATPase family protein [Verrucomicrobiae bacterium]|nr:BadF/BadG/BcrA/BcrD ATPase family protein [Verrucomicrobiae bacterium]
MLYAGVDGGQSSTTAVIGDGERVLARGHAGAADEVGATGDSTRLRDALEGALANALAGAHLPSDTQFQAIVAGVSGYEGRVYGQPPRMPTERFILTHDAPIAHAGAFRGGSGVVVIAGTGSVAYTVAGDGRSKTMGGWGYLFGDEGGAFWIARTFVARATRNAALVRPLLEYFAVPSLRALVRAFYSGEITRERLASFATVALTSKEIADDAARELAQLAASAVLERPCKIAFAGGLMHDPAFLQRVESATRERLPDCTLVAPEADPAEGALILARSA